MQRTISMFILLCFLTVQTPFMSSPTVHAQDGAYVHPARAGQVRPLQLPKPGAMVHLSQPMNPPILKGIKVHPNDPFRFDFILDKGGGDGVIASEAKQSVEGIAASPSAPRNDTELKQEANRLIKYFLASITTPEGDLWVNLSPYEKDRIIPNSFGQTEMGRDLLAQDYMLKQITASLIYPEDELGRKFWKRIYEEAQAKYGTTNIPVNTFNKVWIVPDKAVVYENNRVNRVGWEGKKEPRIDGAGHTAYVVESRLKVMLEVDYLALEKNIVGAGPRPASFTKGANQREGAGLEPARTDVNQLGSQIIREIVIPALTREVNEGANFAQLRQVYNSLILATWYKKKIKDSILAKVYADQNKVAGVGYDQSVVLSEAKDHKEPLDPSAKKRPQDDTERIYQQYLQAFKKGVYNYIKEDVDPVSQERMPRKYFSGGFNFAMVTPIVYVNTMPRFDQLDKAVVVTTNLMPGDKTLTTDSSQLSDFRLSNSQRKAWMPYYLPDPKVVPWLKHGLPGYTDSLQALDPKEWAVFMVKSENINDTEFDRVAQSVSDGISSSAYKSYEYFLLKENAFSHRSPEGSPVVLLWAVSKSDPTHIMVSYVNQSLATTPFSFKSSVGLYLGEVHGLDRPEVPGASHSLRRIMSDGRVWKEGSLDAPWGVISTMRWSRTGSFGKVQRKVNDFFTNTEVRDGAFFALVITGAIGAGMVGLDSFANSLPGANKQSFWELLTLSDHSVYTKMLLLIAPGYYVTQGVRALQAKLARGKTERVDRAMNSNIYVQQIDQMLHTRVTEESVKRRNALRDVGSQFERYLREYYHDPDIKIAIIPKGSTLRGYAGKDSDIEYSILILSGKVLQGGTFFYKDEKIFKEKFGSLIGEAGFKVDQEYKYIHNIPVQNLIAEPEECFKGENRNIIIDAIATLFLPAVYGDIPLIETARRNAIRWINKYNEGNVDWDEIQHKFAQHVLFNPIKVEVKLHLADWLRAQSVNPDSEEEIDQFRDGRFREVGLPSLEIMSQIYGDEAMNGEQKTSSFPTTPELAAEGVKAFQTMVAALPETLSGVIGRDRDVLKVYTGIAAEIQYSIYNLKEPDTLIRVIELNKNMRVIRHTRSQISILNLAAAQRVMTDNNDFFPSNDPNWLIQNVDEWFLGLTQNDNERTIRYGLLSGYPRNAAIKFTQRSKALAKISARISNEYHGPDEWLLRYKQEAIKTGKTKAQRKEEFRSWFLDVLSEDDVTVLVDEYSMSKFIAGMGFAAYSTEDFVWTRDLVSIHNNALKGTGLEWHKFGDLAMKTQNKNTGGIDFNADKINLQTRNEGGEIQFNLDPTQLQELQNIPGFTPVIINIQPLKSLNLFLGIQTASPSPEPVS